MTASLKQAEWGERAARVLSAAVHAVEPGWSIQRFVQRRGQALEVAGEVYSLEDFQRVVVVGAGKAGAPMARALSEILGDRLSEGLVVVKEGYGGGSSLQEINGSIPGRKAGPRVEILEARHPIPDRRGVEATGRLIELLQQAGEDDLVFCLLSGGGSALLTAPSPGVTLDDLQKLTALLLRCGATINEMNCLRKHLDEIKGGKLARIAAPAKVTSLILSDVVGDPLDVIASGPTVPDPTTFEDARKILENYGLLEEAPHSILVHLQKGLRKEIADTPKAGDTAFERVRNLLVGNNLLAAQAAQSAAEAEGTHALLLTTSMQGEARAAGRFLASIARQFGVSGDEPLPRPACLIAGGETTVTVRGDGMGGRNQELALSAVSEIAGLRDVALVSLATDGGDGPTDAAGAVVTGDSLARALALGLDPQEYLRRNDSYPFFEALGDLLKPGPTRTNVNDLAFIFAF